LTKHCLALHETHAICRDEGKKANSRRRKKREVGGEKERATSDAESVTGIVT